MKVPTEYIFTLKTNYGETAPQYRCTAWPAGGWRPLRDTYNTQAIRVRCYRATYRPTHLRWLFTLLCWADLPHLAVKLPGYWGNTVLWTEYKV